MKWIRRLQYNSIVKELKLEGITDVLTFDEWEAMRIQEKCNHKFKATEVLSSVDPQCVYCKGKFSYLKTYKR